MAVLGKRKASSRSEPTSEEALSAEEIFRRHFEAQFAPLEEDPVAKRQAVAQDDDEEDSEGDDVDDEDEDEEDDEDDEWGGLSDDEISASDNDVAVEVIDHSTSQPKTESMSKADLKAFMSSRPPSQTSKPKPTPEATATTAKSLPEDAPSLLKQDLELRRLLSESHLLHSQPLTQAEPAPFAAGRTKLKATDMRIQALGSKTSILKQDKMSMNMRKGITAHREAKEAKRRKEAKENGIILERPEVKKKRSKGSGKREIGVDRPGIGRMRGAELRISEGDVRKIEGSRDTFGRRGARGGRTGGRGGKRR